MMDPTRRLIRSALAQERGRNDLRRWTGQVSAVDTVNKRASVKLRGEATATTNIPYPLNYTPAVNDWVYVLFTPPCAYVILGPANLTATA